MTLDTAQLIVQLEGQVIQIVPLTGGPLTIGRLPDNGLPLSHPLVSRRHAEARPEGDGLLLTDLGSTTGTLVAGRRLAANQPERVASGDSFTIGPFTLTFVGLQKPVDAGPPEDALPPAEPPPPERQPPEQPVAGEEAPPPAEPSAAEAPWAGEQAPAPADEQEMQQAAPPDEEPAPVVVAANGSASKAALLAMSRALAQRPQLPELPPRGPLSRYLGDLPVLYQGNDFLGRFLLIFESLWEPLEQRQDHIAMYFDPRTSPASFLPWLADWLGIAVSRHWPEARLRRLVDEAMELYQWRGTRYGLEQMIEVCTGVRPTVSNDPDRPFVIRVSITAPPGGELDRALVEDLLRTHKPAHVGYELVISS